MTRIMIVVWVLAGLTIIPDSHSRTRVRPPQAPTRFRCGQEYKIETRDGVMLQGRLQPSLNDSLTLSVSGLGSHTIAISDVTSAYHVRRRTGEGTVAGVLFGTLTGFAVAMMVNSADEPGDEWLAELGEIEERITRGVMITVAGAFIGGVIGHSLGHRSQMLGPVELGASPLCLTPCGSMSPLEIRLAVNF